MPPLPIAKDEPDSLAPAGHAEITASELRNAQNTRPSSNRTPSSTQPNSAIGQAYSSSPNRHEQKIQEQYQTSIRSSSPVPSPYRNDGSRQTILESFAPHVAFFASEDIDDLAREKGFPAGFYTLLRPFCEQIPGKVVIRDSIGASKAWENFSIRLFQYRDQSSTVQATEDLNTSARTSQERSLHSESPSISYERQHPIDTLLDYSLRSSTDTVSNGVVTESENTLEKGRSGPRASTYGLYLRKLLSEGLQVPHETFSHPVACVIAVSSRSSEPLEKIRQLYSASGHGNPRIPPWVGVDYLRYYVLVHDEDRDDITTSTALFDLMKRHFGLHCHLLRVRSEPYTEGDLDTVQLPNCQWLPADEELRETRMSDNGSTLRGETRIFESEAVAIRGMVREMLTQSVVPFMESRIVTWNDQVASKRRGIGGRFMSLSKRWTGFGSSKASTGPTASQVPSSSNFDADRGFYPPEAPEAIMRQLADYAFMLRDFKLAYTTYEALRIDFSNDKAWTYHASASEMAVVSFLLIQQTLTNKLRIEGVDQKLDSALYSYLTRCSMPSGATRALVLTVELLAGRGPSAAEDAAKWAIRLLELETLGPMPQALITERLADVHQLHAGLGMLKTGSRRRQAAFWTMLASVLWTKLDRPAIAGARLREARAMMGASGHEEAKELPFPTMQHLCSVLGSAEPRVDNDPMSDAIPDLIDLNDDFVDESSKRLNDQVNALNLEPADAGGFSAIEAKHPEFDQR
ncbi:MAG: hypothetical protein Q9194_001389 [Teloschistes cf. exilis]